MNSLKMCKKVIKYLERSSSNKPIPVKKIAKYLKINDGETCPTTRKLILKTMKKCNVPIGSNHKGYYRIHTAQEMQRYLNSLLKRQMGIVERIEVTYNAFHGRYENPEY